MTTSEFKEWPTISEISADSLPQEREHLRSLRKEANEAEAFIGGYDTFLDYIKLAWPQVEAGTEFQCNWHIEAIAIDVIATPTITPVEESTWGRIKAFFKALLES